MAKITPLDRFGYVLMLWIQIFNTLSGTWLYFQTGKLADLCFASVWATFVIVYAFLLMKPNE